MTHDKRNFRSLDQVASELLTIPDVRKGYEEQRAMMAIAKQLKEARLEANLTQQQLATMMDTSQPEIVRLELGLGKRGPSVDTVVRLANALSRQLILGLTDESQPSAVDMDANALAEALQTVTELAKKQAKTLAEKDAVKTLEAIRWVQTF